MNGTTSVCPQSACWLTARMTCDRMKPQNMITKRPSCTAAAISGQRHADSSIASALDGVCLICGLIFPSNSAILVDCFILRRMSDKTEQNKQKGTSGPVTTYWPPAMVQSGAGN